MNSTELFIQEPAGHMLGSTVASLARRNFEFRYLTIMFGAFQVGVEMFLKKYQGSVATKYYGNFIHQHQGYLHQAVIFGDNATEISDIITWLVHAKYNTNAKFIIACGSASGKRCDERIIFQTLSRNLIVNVIVLTTSFRRRWPLAYTYDLAERGKCNNSIPEKVNLAKPFRFKTSPPSQLANFHRCVLGFSTIEQPPFMYLHNGTKPPSGADGDLIRLLADMLNATLLARAPVDKGDCGHYVDNTWIGSLGDVYSGPFHASICSTPLTAYKYGNFQVSSDYYSMDIVWAAKLPSKKASWEKLLYPLNFQIRIALMFIFIVIVIVNTVKNTRVFQKLSRMFGLVPSKLNFLFYSWLLFLGLPIVRLPTRRSLLITIHAWIWFCFIIRSAYQAGLINALKNTAYNEKFDSIQDVIKKGFPYGGVVSLKEYYTQDPEIYNGWVDIDLEDLEDIVDSILDGTTDFVLASNKIFILHQLKKYNGTKRLQIIPKKIVNSPSAVFFRRYSPVVFSVNHVLQIAFEGGFVQRLYDKYLHQDNQKLRTHNDQAQSLTMEHFAGAFLIMTIGWLVSIIYFIVEVVCGNLDDNDGL